jgi:hypothetical protein
MIPTGNIFSPAAYMLSNEAKSQARRAETETGNLRNRVKILENNVAKALLINEALWELIREKLRLTDDELNDKLYAVDMRDGTLDGKNQRSHAMKCPQCNRTVSHRHAACLYCGHIMDDSVFSLT